MRAIRRITALVGDGERNFVRETAIGRHAEQLSAISGAGASGTEQHALAVRGPADRPIGSRMVRQALWFTARCRHHEHVDVAVVFSFESDLRAVRREYRIGFDARTAGEAFGLAAVARHAPKIACVGKDDLRGAQRGSLQ